MKKSKRNRRKKRARRADKFELYEKAVQEPEADIRLIERIFRNHYGRSPRRLREDFCGTAILACRWVEEHRDNRAWGIDLDSTTLRRGRDRNVAALTPEQSARVKLIEGNVLDVGHEKVDVTAAFNFSYFVFTTRADLREYFEKARATLVDEGILILDAYGGADAQRTGEERRPVGGFHYIWDQHEFDPIQNRVVNFIHFIFPDGSKLRRAFRYDWRLWSLPEIREVLVEAGFSTTEVYWEGTNHETGEGNDVFTRREHAPDDPAWVAYIVGKV